MIDEADRDGDGEVRKYIYLNEWFNILAIYNFILLSFKGEPRWVPTDHEEDQSILISCGTNPTDDTWLFCIFDIFVAFPVTYSICLQFPAVEMFSIPFSQ